MAGLLLIVAIKPCLPYASFIKLKSAIPVAIAVIRIKVKTQVLELEVVDDTSQNLTDVANEFVRVAQSQPIQNSIQTPIVVHQLATAKEDGQAQLPLFVEANKEEEQQQLRVTTITGNAKVAKRLARGTGQETQAYTKILEMIPQGHFDTGKNFAEITNALANVGYIIKSKRLADALLRLVREKHLIREGQRRKYVYKKVNASSSAIKTAINTN